MYKSHSEEDLKQTISQEWFQKCDYHPGWHGIDAVFEYKGNKMIFAEAKHKSTDINVMFAQLIFTTYKIKDDDFLPKYLCVFDCEKIAFIPSSEIEPLFDEYKNADFNWNVTPSNHNTKEFKKISQIIENAINNKQVLFEQDNIFEFKQTLFYFDKDKVILKEWINHNIFTEIPGGPMRISDSNFNKVYNDWLDKVKFSIDEDWNGIRTAYGILDCDYFLADLLSKDNWTLNDKLFVLLENEKYNMVKPAIGGQKDLWNKRTIYFNDHQNAHKQFWNRYERPPEDEYWDIILKRRDLLVPHDIRKRLGAFFTPPEWVELSQQYLADVFGENWLEEYYIWDCAAGTGNLLQGLNSPQGKYHIFASDINIENVYIMQGRIEDKMLNMLPSHCFQFDFLNDEFDTLPPDLQSIIKDDKKRKKLIIYINPPYAEATEGIGLGGIIDVHNTAILEKYRESYGSICSKELFVQFFIRIYEELPNCKLASFSTLKYVNSSNFVRFREHFKAKFRKGFIVPANTFDNVQGQFPIGFLIWDLGIQKTIQKISVDVYDVKVKIKKDIIFKKIKEFKRIGEKQFYSYENCQYINEWIINYGKVANGIEIGTLYMLGNDFQNNQQCRIENNINKSHLSFLSIDKQSLIYACIYLSVRHCIPATWINDRDQFLYPKDSYKKDKEFHNDCLAFTLFHSQNRITSKDGTNHWIPFRESEVDAKGLFDSHFMVDFINGKIELQANGLYEEDGFTPIRSFSKEASDVFAAGRALWKYYHNADFTIADDEYNINASLYDIRKHFQGESKGGRMKSKSDDTRYIELMNELRSALDVLASKIETKVYKHGFLLE